MHADFPLPEVDWAPLRDFWAGAEAGELRMPRCPSCERIHWYPDGACRRCGSAGPWRWVPVRGEGSLFAWTVVTHAFLPQLRDQLPLIPALVSLADDPDVRLVTRIVDAAPDDLRIGQPMRVVFGPLAFPGIDRTVIAPFFTPA